MKTDMNKKQKNTRTFLIKIMDQQNGTWQGSVTWWKSSESSISAVPLNY